MIQKCDIMGKKWHGGKGDRRRKSSDDRKYRQGWDHIFGNGNVNQNDKEKNRN